MKCSKWALGIMRCSICVEVFLSEGVEVERTFSIAKRWYGIGRILCRFMSKNATEIYWWFNGQTLIPAKLMGEIPVQGYTTIIVLMLPEKVYFNC